MDSANSGKGKLPALDDENFITFFEKAKDSNLIGEFYQQLKTFLENNNEFNDTVKNNIKWMVDIIISHRKYYKEKYNESCKDMRRKAEKKENDIKILKQHIQALTDLLEKEQSKNVQHNQQCLNYQTRIYNLNSALLGKIVNDYRNREYQKNSDKESEEVKKAKCDNRILSTSKHPTRWDKVPTAEYNQQQRETERNSQLEEAKNKIASLEKKFNGEHEKVIKLQKDKEDLSNKLQAAEKNEAMWENNYRSANNYVREKTAENQQLCLKIKSATAGFGEKTKLFVNEILCNAEKIDSLVRDPTVDVLNDWELHDLQEQLDLYEPPPKRMRRMPSNKRCVPDDSSSESEKDEENSSFKATTKTL